MAEGLRRPDSAGSIQAARGGKSFQFTGTLTVKAGAKVSVTNSDSTHHSVTDNGGKFDTGEITGGTSGSFTAPTAPGSYQLKCTFHPQMIGTLVVQ